MNKLINVQCRVEARRSRAERKPIQLNETLKALRYFRPPIQINIIMSRPNSSFGEIKVHALDFPKTVKVLSKQLSVEKNVSYYMKKN